jgi:hypothetical protein
LEVKESGHWRIKKGLVIEGYRKAGASEDKARVGHRRIKKEWVTGG